MRRTNYDAIAQAYDQRYERNEFRALESVVDDFATRGESQRLLEVGCGTGHWLARLAARGVAVAGLDASLEMLAKAREKLADVELVHGRAESLPWHDASFDRVLCINALHHFSDKVTFVREARRVLRPGGALLIIGLDPHSGFDRWFIYEWFDGVLELDLARYPATAEIREWLNGAGFSDIATSVAQHAVASLDAETAIQKGQLNRAATSQLTILTEAEYASALERIRERAASERAQGRALHLEVDVRLYATRGSAGV
jgi:ubiquinone/menaquinone biosynthesis C-methylase UbiE